ncbi:MAG: hypothetical protein MK193_00460 [Lentisphaeria bacterium]|nr:hypothetical protein [Lentisphaeria bacterium]
MYPILILFFICLIVAIYRYKKHQQNLRQIEDQLDPILTLELQVARTYKSGEYEEALRLLKELEVLAPASLVVLNLKPKILEALRV